MIIFRDIIHIAEENLALDDENESEYGRNNVQTKPASRYSFVCTYCGTQYQNKYCDAAKKHDTDRGGKCPLKEMYNKGIIVPNKNNVLEHVKNQVSSEVEVIEID